LGTPHANNWPDAMKLSDYKTTFPKFKGMPLTEHTKNLSEIELDLLKGLCSLDPSRRISAKMALLHPYFDSMDKT
jgi:serine/threonine protein kinase